MSTTKKPYLEILPSEILHRIYDELDTETILFSIRCLSKRFYSITKDYNRHRLDLRYVPRSDLRVMARLIDPKNVISLMLSDEEQTYGQIRLFLSHFLIDQFSQLRSLTLIAISDKDLDQFQKSIMKCSLTTVSISFSGSYSESMKKFLSSILSCKDIRKFELGNRDDIIRGMRWPIQCRVEHMAIVGTCTWDIVYFILTHSPHLRTLVLKDFRRNKSGENIMTQPDINQPIHLTSLLLYICWNITMDDVESVLTLLPKLTHLRLFGPGSNAHPSLFDGSRWENCIETKLPLLNQFEFCLTRPALANQDFTPIESLLAPFRTPFWLEMKHWFVKCDYEYSKDNGRFHLYSIPIFRDKFNDSNRKRTILNSTSNTIDNNEPIIVNAPRLTLDLNQIMAEYMQEKTNLTTKYIFRNVTELMLMIDQEWPIDSIEHLSTIVDLSNLQTICLDFQCECKVAVSLDVEMDALFKRAWNLRSIRIICNDYEDMTLIKRNDSEKMMLITRNAIALKLPRHIKQLDIEINDLNDAKIILEQGKHLSRVTFRPLRRGENFADEIPSWLSDMKRDYVCRLDWGYFCNCECCDSVKAVYLWLDKKHE